MLNFFKKDLQYIIFVIASVALPLTKTYLPYIMFLWVLSGLFCIRKINLAKFKNKILIIFPFIFYLLFVYFDISQIILAF